MRTLIVSKIKILKNGEDIVEVIHFGVYPAAIVVTKVAMGNGIISMEQN